MAYFIVRDKNTNEVLRMGSCTTEEIVLQIRNNNETVEEVNTLPIPEDPGLG